MIEHLYGNILHVNTLLALYFSHKQRPAKNLFNDNLFEIFIIDLSHERNQSFTYIVT